MSILLFPSVCWCKRWNAISHFEDYIAEDQEETSDLKLKTVQPVKKEKESKKQEKKHKLDDDDDDDDIFDMEHYDDDPELEFFGKPPDVILPKDDEYQVGELDEEELEELQKETEIKTTDDYVLAPRIMISMGEKPKKKKKDKSGRKMAADDEDEDEEIAGMNEPYVVEVNRLSRQEGDFEKAYQIDLDYMPVCAEWAGFYSSSESTKMTRIAAVGMTHHVVQLFDIEKSGAPCGTLDLNAVLHKKSKKSSGAKMLKGGMDEDDSEEESEIEKIKRQIATEGITKQKLKSLKKKLKQIEEEEQRKELENPNHVTCMKTNPEHSHILACGYTTGVVCVWDVQTETPIALLNVCDFIREDGDGRTVLSIAWGRSPVDGDPEFDKKGWMSASVLVCGCKSGDMFITDIRSAVAAAVAPQAGAPLASPFGFSTPSASPLGHTAIPTVPSSLIYHISKTKLDRSGIESMSFVPPFTHPIPSPPPSLMASSASVFGAADASSASASTSSSSSVCPPSSSPYLLFCTTQHGSIHCIDLHNLQKPEHLLQLRPHSKSATSLSFSSCVYIPSVPLSHPSQHSSNHHLLVTGGEDARCVFWDVSITPIARASQTPGAPGEITFDVNMQKITSKMVKKKDGEAQPVFGVSCCPENTWIAVASQHTLTPLDTLKIAQRANFESLIPIKKRK